MAFFAINITTRVFGSICLSRMAQYAAAGLSPKMATSQVPIKDGDVSTASSISQLDQTTAQLVRNGCFSEMRQKKNNRGYFLLRLLDIFCLVVPFPSCLHSVFERLDGSYWHTKCRAVELDISIIVEGIKY